jgi:hypothetical protein
VPFTRRMNAIYLRRHLKVVTPVASGVTEVTVIAALQKNIASLGFVLAPEVCECLARAPVETIPGFYRELVECLREMVGAHREFRPFYPNFPEEVMASSEVALYWNAIVHYCTNRLLPLMKRESTPLLEDTELKVITLGTRVEFEAIFTRLASSKIALSTEDKADMDWFVRQYRDDVLRLMPDTVPVKENLALIGAALLMNTTLGIEWLSPRIATATDVLRIAVAMNGGDVSLAEPAKFGNFSRRQRALLLSWIERCENATEDMLRWKGRWIRLGERLHPGDYVRSFPKVFAAYAVLRNDEPFTTFNSRVERALEGGDGAAGVALLEARPGEMTRRLDHLLRSAVQPEAVIEGFRRRAANVASPLLLQAMAHFQRRDAPAELRTFFPKGDVGKVHPSRTACRFCQREWREPLPVYARPCS